MILLDGSSLSLEQLLNIADGAERVGLTPEARTRVRASREVVERRARGDEPAYGINTGFGSFADVKIARGALETLQLNLLRSHAAGVGDPLPVRAVRATMALRANVLAKGFSGISIETLDALIALVNNDVHPRVPSRGSVGASGDLAPLAHLALVLIGEGEAVFGRSAESLALHDVGRAFQANQTMPGADALERAGLKPIVLGAKEGLALINGTQPSTAVLALALAAADQLARAADIAAALSIDALRGSIHPFEGRVHAARPFRGQQISAANIERLMHGSGINESHEFCGKIQDAYSMRCAPQVHGAAREALRFVRETVAIEANSATDNPMVFAETGDIVSCGNFHGAPIAIAADLLAAAIVPIATISERRTDRLVNRLHAGAGHGRRRRVGAQDARASGRRRHDHDVGEQGGPRQHEHDGRIESRRRGRARARGGGHRNFMCMSGDRPARAARHVAAVEKCSLARPIARADARIRSPAVARHRRDRRSDCIERARKRMRRCSQVKNIFFLN